MTFADEQIVYRDLAGAWGSFRLVVGGRDVTAFRDVPAQIGGYQLTEPYGYGPADFSFPQITSLEVDAWGVDGDLSWFDMGKSAKLVQVDAAGVRVRTVWEGFISTLSPSLDGTDVHCDGEASGRLALRDRHPRLFNQSKDIGRWLNNAFSLCGLNLKPGLGLDTGIEVDGRGRSGTYLSYVDQLLADGQTGTDQLTISPDPTGGYLQHYKDLDTVHGTVFNGAAGVSLDVTRDLQEEPTTIYGTGRNPGDDKVGALVWVNAVAPGLVQGEAPTFPGALSLGDSGPNIQVLQAKLIGMGYLGREDAAGDTFDGDTEDAVKDLQDDAGLSETGVVNSATWDALFDLGDTGLSLGQARVRPLAELTEVKKWRLTSNGSISSANPNYDPSRVEVDLTVDHGVVKKSRARKWSRKQLAKIHNGKNWVGSLTLSTDVVVGDHTHVEAAPEGVMSRLDLTAGMNLRVRNFDGATKFHVSGINVDSDLTVRLAVDTKARDLLTVGQIIARNRESRINHARQWLRQQRGTDANHAIVEFNELGGKVWNKIPCAADEWTVFPVVAGQSGSINQIRIKVSNSECEFVVAASAKKTSPAFWRRLAPNPFNGFNREKLLEEADAQRAILGIWGDEDQPCGYHPGNKTGDDGTATGDPVTGLFLDDGGFDYHTFAEPVIWVAVYPKQACNIEPQRVLWPVLDSGM